MGTTKKTAIKGRSEIPTAICFCSGYGGLEKGIERVLGKVRVLAFSEIEAYPIANLISKMEAGELENAPLWTDLKTFPGEMFRDKVDILTGGFPCQPFSAVGRREGDEDPRHLFPYFIRSIRSIRPRQVFLENVEGILSATIKSDGWNDPIGTPVLLHVCRELEREGYRVEAGIFSAEEVGAPHQRKRVFILAELDHPECEGLEGSTYDERVDTQLRQTPIGSVRQASGASPTHSNWPAKLGEDQKPNEPARAFNIDSSCKSGLGGNINGLADELDATKRRMENRADRLKLCGNGVVPQTAERAYRVLTATTRRMVRRLNSARGK